MQSICRNPSNNDEHANFRLLAGNYWKHLDSIVLSHVLDEASTFVPDEIKTDQDFSNYLSGIIPPYGERAGLKSRIIARYPPVGDGRGTYATERQRFAAFFGDFVFLCGIRGLTDAYTGKSYNVQYSQIPYTHGADTYAQFYFPGFNLGLLNLTGVAGFSDFAQTYQSYLISQVRTGDPNVYRKSYGGFKAIRWPKLDNRGDALRGVLNATGTGFELITDEQTKKSACEFWEEIVKELTELGGSFVFNLIFFFYFNEC